MKKMYFSLFNIVLLILLFNHWDFGVSNSVTQDVTNEAISCVTFIEPEVLIQLGDSIELSLQSTCSPPEALSIIWEPTDYLTCSDCFEPYVRPLEDICYTVTINWQDGCQTTNETCIEVISCDNQFTENHINSITPQEIEDSAEIELELTQLQYVHLEIVDDGEIKYPIKEGWMGPGLITLELDFSDVPSGNHELRARLYPENRFIDIVKL